MNQWGWTWAAAASAAGITEEEIKGKGGQVKSLAGRRGVFCFLSRMGCTQREIATWSWRDDSAVHAILKRINSAGLCDRSRAVVIALAREYVSKNMGTVESRKQARRIIKNPNSRAGDTATFEESKKTVVQVPKLDAPVSVNYASTVVASGAIYRRHPQTKEIVWGENNKPFAKLAGRAR